MKNARKNLPVPIVIVLLLVWVSFPIWRDYSWAGRIEDRMEDQPFTLVHRQNNVVDIARPWQLIHQPTDTLWYVHHHHTRLADDLVLTHHVRISRSETAGSFALIHLDNHAYHFVGSDEDPLPDAAAIDFDAIDWQYPEHETPARTIIDHLVDRFEPSETPGSDPEKD